MSLKRSWVADWGYATPLRWFRRCWQNLGDRVTGMARDGISEARSTTNRAMATDGELGSSTRWVDVNGLRVHCLTAGRGGSPVVLLHGGGLTRQASTATSSDRSPKSSAACSRQTGRGRGERQTGPRLRYGLLRRLPGAPDGCPWAERASLVGISMGGGAALGSLSAHQNVSRSWSW